MTRTEIAAMAMQGILASDTNLDHSHEDIAGWAVVQADILIAELAKGTPDVGEQLAASVLVKCLELWVEWFHEETTVAKCEEFRARHCIGGSTIDWLRTGTRAAIAAARKAGAK